MRYRKSALMKGFHSLSHACCANSLSSYSGIPSGGNTTFKILSINLYFRILSFTVVDVSDGEAFTYGKLSREGDVGSSVRLKELTSTSQAFKLLSIIMS